MKQLLMHWIIVYGYPGIFAGLLLLRRLRRSKE